MSEAESREVSVANRSAHLDVADGETETLFVFLDTLGRPSLAAGEISIVLMDDTEHNQLHADFLNDTTTTDVITFPGDVEMEFAGEIAVNVQQAWRRREESQGADFARELSLYLIHGWLHLCGHEDKTDEGRAAMRAAETEVINECASAGKLPVFVYRESSD